MSDGATVDSIAAFLRVGPLDSWILAKLSPEFHAQVREYHLANVD